MRLQDRGRHTNRNGSWKPPSPTGWFTRREDHFHSLGERFLRDGQAPEAERSFLLATVETKEGHKKFGKRLLNREFLCDVQPGDGHFPAALSSKPSRGLTNRWGRHTMRHCKEGDS